MIEKLTEVRNREPRYEVFRNHHMKVRFYGRTALVNGITSVKGSAGSLSRPTSSSRTHW